MRHHKQKSKDANYTFNIVSASVTVLMLLKLYIHVMKIWNPKLGGDPDPGFLATGTKLGLKSSYMYLLHL